MWSKFFSISWRISTTYPGKTPFRLRPQVVSSQSYVRRKPLPPADVSYRRQHNLRIKVARIFNTYGPRMHPNDGRVVSNFIVQALLGNDITIYGDGSQTRAFCYVDDLIDGLIRLMATADSVTGPINIGNPGEFTMLELASMVLDISGSRSKIVHRPLPQDDPKQRRPDISKAHEVLGWAPRTPLREGLGRTIEYFDNFLKDESVRTRVTAGSSA